MTLEKKIQFYRDISRTIKLESIEIRLNQDVLATHDLSQNRLLLKDLESDFSYCGAHLPFENLNPISEKTILAKESMDILKKAICLSGELNFKYLVMHLHGKRKGIFPKQSFFLWQEIVSELFDFATDSGLLLTVENADSIINLTELVTLVKNIDDSKLKITLDVGHAYRRKIFPLTGIPLKTMVYKAFDIITPKIVQEDLPFSDYESLSAFIRREKRTIGNIHIHDYNGIKDHLEIGKGKIDFSFLQENSAL